MTSSDWNVWDVKLINEMCLVEITPRSGVFGVLYLKTPRLRGAKRGANLTLTFHPTPRSEVFEVLYLKTPRLRGAKRGANLYNKGDVIRF